MRFSQRISKELSQSMKKLGFSKKGNRFFKIENDIAFCVDIETPSCLPQVHVYIMPLYIHRDFRYYSYGNRLNYIFRNVPVISSKCDENEFREWIALVTETIQTQILSYFERIHNPNALLSFLEDENSEYRRFLFCMSTPAASYPGRPLMIAPPAAPMWLWISSMTATASPIPQDTPPRAPRRCSITF